MPEVLHLDAPALRVLAHPLRARLLSQLRLHGPATATELADRLRTNTGATSYHLRRLEEAGLVADTGTGAGKRRVWEASTRSHEWDASEFAGDPEAEASLAWLSRHYQSNLNERVDGWIDRSPEWPAEWRDVLGFGDDGVMVTSAQAAVMRQEIEAVIARHREAGAGDPGAIRVLVWTHLLPVDDRPPGEPTTGDRR